MRLQCIIWLLCGMSLLAGCSSYPLYHEHIRVHPQAGTMVHCGHWIWWECEVFGYRRYVEVPTLLEQAVETRQRQ